MNEGRAKLFAELLEEIATIDGGFVPDVAWKALHRLIPMPAVEVLITRNEGKEFLLTYRDDNEWKGWHIPGGFIRHQESIEETCNRIAKEEVGVQVTGLKAIAISKWKKHPFGASPISLVMVCFPVGIVKETHVKKYFDAIPNQMIADDHVEFLATYLDFIRKKCSETALLRL